MKYNIKFMALMAGAVLARCTCSRRVMDWYFHRFVLEMFPGGTGISVGEE